MTYQLSPVSFSVTCASRVSLPASFDYALISAWVLAKADATTYSIGHLDGKAGVLLNLSTPDLLSYGSAAQSADVAYSGNFPSGAGWINVLCSIDSQNRIHQLYINDVPLGVAGTAPFPLVPLNIESTAGGLLLHSRPGGITEVCQADVYFAATTVFYDLSIEANRRKFIDAAGRPVDLGADGAVPTGLPPAMFLTVRPGGVPADFLTNSGTGGGTFTTAGALSFCTVPPPPPPPANDLVAIALPPSLGRWRGQVGLNWMGMALVGDAFSPVVGLSDYNAFTEYGNTMRFLVTTPPLHDDRKRIFIPRFEIEVEAGQGTPGGGIDDAPQIMLDISKDGGKTWGDLQRWRSMGKVGEYIQRLRWINLGHSRTWIFRLTCTDPVRRYVIGTYLDQYKGTG